MHLKRSFLSSSVVANSAMLLGMTTPIHKRNNPAPKVTSRTRSQHIQVSIPTTHGRIGTKPNSAFTRLKPDSTYLFKLRYSHILFEDRSYTPQDEMRRENIARCQTPVVRYELLGRYQLC